MKVLNLLCVGLDGVENMSHCRSLCLWSCRPGVDAETDRASDSNHCRTSPFVPFQERIVSPAQPAVLVELLTCGLHLLALDGGCSSFRGFSALKKQAGNVLIIAISPGCSGLCSSGRISLGVAVTQLLFPLPLTQRFQRTTLPNSMAETGASLWAGRSGFLASSLEGRSRSSPSPCSSVPVCCLQPGQGTAGLW